MNISIDIGNKRFSLPQEVTTHIGDLTQQVKTLTKALELANADDKVVKLEDDLKLANDTVEELRDEIVRLKKAPDVVDNSPPTPKVEDKKKSDERPFAGNKK